MFHWNCSSRGVMSCFVFTCGESQQVNRPPMSLRLLGGWLMSVQSNNNRNHPVTPQGKLTTDPERYFKCLRYLANGGREQRQFRDNGFFIAFGRCRRACAAVDSSIPWSLSLSLSPIARKGTARDHGHRGSRCGGFLQSAHYRYALMSVIYPGTDPRIFNQRVPWLQVAFGVWHSL